MLTGPSDCVTLDIVGVTMLGPVGVDGDGQHLAPRDRVVLAVLAMSPRELVTPERLADALYDEDPPGTWTKVVQGSISRIRKALGADAVRTTRQGYVLDLPDDEIDGLRFEQLVRRGSELLTLKDPDRAQYVLTQALDVASGEVVCTLDGHGVIGLDFSPDGGRIATGGLEGRTIVWDATDGTELLQLPALDHQVSSVSFSPDVSPWPLRSAPPSPAPL